DITHPFIKYGLAVIMRENNLNSIDEITREHLINEVENSKNHFRVKPLSEGHANTVNFHFSNDQKGNPSKGVYLAPNVLASDMSARYIYSSFQKVIKELERENSTNIDLTRGIATVTGEFLSFGDKSTGRGKAKVLIEIAALCLITNTTDKKPCLNFRAKDFENVAIIPDLDLSNLINFINLFERMKNQSTASLMVGKIYGEDNKPHRPKIYDGNFPNAPSSNSLGAIALLGAMG